jgi:hypothetical protein
MPEWVATSLSYVLSRWERLLFGVVGAAFLFFTFQNLRANNVTAGSALFGMAFFSFFYSNLARFKKFKGLGFEAELWEDKQKEASDLIERLKSIVTVYTHEIVMGSVMRGRFGADSWQKRWDLLDRLTGQHTELGQNIDFSETKHDMDSVFIFDICSDACNVINQDIQRGLNQARAKTQEKYGSPVTDLAGYNRDNEKLRAITFKRDDLFERARTSNIANEMLIEARAARQLLISSFDITVELDDQAIGRLETTAGVAAKRPITVTPELIAWADERLTR